MICIDLGRRPGEEQKSEEETFELKDIAQVPGRVVAVSDRGFRVAVGTGPDVETVMSEMPPRIATEVPDSPPAPMFDACAPHHLRWKEEPGGHGGYGRDQPGLLRRDDPSDTDREHDFRRLDRTAVQKHYAFGEILRRYEGEK